MPGGRPKGSTNKPKPVADLFNQNTTHEVMKQPISTTAYKSTSYCEWCGKRIDYAPYKVRLESITGKANWHRRCNTDRFSICSSCAEDFSNYIDDYILKKVPNKSKYTTGERRAKNG